MTDADIRDVLHRATRDLAAPPDLLERSRARGHRRLVRRRSMIAAGLALVVAGSGAGVWRLGGEPAADPVASPLFNATTRGDLADDAAFLDRVRDAWRTHLGSDLDVVGAPHVVWAGDTPAGPVAAVAQRTPEKPAGGTHGQVEYGLFGFVETTAQGLRGTWTEGLTTKTEQATGMIVGPDRDVLVLLDDGKPVELSPSYSYAADGRIVRQFSPLPFADGAAVVKLKSRPGRIDFALRRPGGEPQQQVSIVNFGEIARPPGSQLPDVEVLHRLLPAGDSAWPAVETAAREAADRWAQRALAPYIDPTSGAREAEAPWHVLATTPDGRRLMLRTLGHNGDPQRILGLLGGPDAVPTVHYGGTVDPRAALPVKLRLPDEQGIVVAAKGAGLRYRAGDGEWVRVDGDAALLPHTATEVEVARPGAGPETVSLR